MTTSLRFGSALSVIALATTLGGCAGLGGKSARSSVVSDTSKVGLAMRAQIAMAGKDYGSAVNYAEQAAEHSPKSAEMRSLLGNVYFAAGRFASAEGAYRDSLSLQPEQPQVILRMALVQIAQGRKADAVNFLNTARASLDASDYGLALALAGRTAEAVAVLEERARQVDADSQVRQNLALALALSGDWTNARIIASQDLAPGQVDARIQQWMAFAQPTSASSQVAALVGVTPAASDPGQPVRLALNAPVQAPAVAVAEAAPVQQPSYEVAALQPAEATGISIAPEAPIATTNVAPASAVASAPPEYVAPKPAFIRAAAVQAKRRAPAAKVAGKASAKSLLRNASLPRASGNSAAVVQLGAYGSPERVSQAWDSVAKRYTALRAYTPMSARFASNHGTVYRLSVKGFSNVREAQGLCAALKKAGGSCFVRSVAGDAPVRMASR